eukprot:8356851-Ditylum_brightwellii.AAC.1
MTLLIAASTMMAKKEFECFVVGCKIWVQQYHEDIKGHITSMQWKEENNWYSFLIYKYNAGKILLT